MMPLIWSDTVTVRSMPPFRGSGNGNTIEGRMPAS